MNISVYFTPNFNKRFKKYQRKFQSIDIDLKLFVENLADSRSVDLGGGIFKYRLLVKSKNKGKSGGFRIITFELLVTESEKDITLISIYDKSELPSISKLKILEILRQEGII